MSATMTANGKPRKQLSDQLDRLDAIIDALGEALPEAVTDAARAGSRQAVLDAITEVLTSPELKGFMKNMPPPTVMNPAEPVTPQPGPWARFKARLAAARDAVRARCHTYWTTVTQSVSLLASVVPLKKVFVIGTAVGATVAAVSYFCPHEVAAVIGGVAGTCTAVAAQVGWWLWLAARRLGVI